ncbi:MAG: HEPN domain-containing protein [Ignavibacteriae bacterium]|nr:HEPN domain-containing protein [Ignavibacteriota bacterium]
MTIQEQVDYWIDLAEQDLPVADSLFKNGHFMWCLYIGHLILEKALKARYVKDNELTPPKVHDRLKLAKSTKLKLTKENEEFLNRVTDFNIEARYTDYKSNFYKLCTKDFTETNFAKIKETYEWIKKELI